MIEMSQERTKRMVAVHGWSGTVLGLLLYAVVFTGAVAVFASEIGAWSRGGAVDTSGLPDRLHRHLAHYAGKVDPAYHERINVSTRVDGTVRLSFQHRRRDPTTGATDEHAEVFFIRPDDGAMVRRQSGVLRDIVGDDPRDALERFLVDLHVRLYVPEPWGLLLTGVLGLAMMAAAVSGMLMHRHLLRDLFTAPRGHGRLADTRDRHVLAAAWGLPFSILLAFTGAFFSFAISLGVPLVALVAFGGDQDRLIATVLAPPTLGESRPASLASLDYVMADARIRAGAPVTGMLIERFGTDRAMVTTRHAAANGALLPTTLSFDGETRRFLGEKPTLGTVPSAGSAAVSLMLPLHFGNFAGVASKTAWFALGLAMSFVIATGMLLWVRRRQQRPLWRRFGIAVEVTIWSLPIGLLGSAVAFFLTLPSGDPIRWTPAGFVAALLIAVWIGARCRDRVRRLRSVAGVLCLGLPLLRHLTGGTSWSEALIDGQSAVLTIDLLLLCAGGVLLAARTAWPARRPAMAMGPAE
ncbi:MAG: PepSY domain-containing protein [Pseudomonadota bacterium]